MQRLIGVGDVKPFLEQGGGKVLATRTMPPDREALFLRLIPRIHASLIVQPRLYLRRVVGKNRKRGHAVVTIILILVVTPDDAEIGLEFVQRAARPAKTVNHRLAMLLRMRPSFIGSPLATHSLRPVIDRTQPLRQCRICQAHLDPAGYVPLDREPWIMSDAKPKYLPHRWLLASYRCGLACRRGRAARTAESSPIPHGRPTPR